MVQMLIIGHGDFGRSLLESAFNIVGTQEGASALSNQGLSLEQLKRKVADFVATDLPTLVFVDFYGSTYTAAKTGGGGAPIISGVNLPMLLSFFNKRNNLSFEELVKTVAEDGKRGIRH